MNTCQLEQKKFWTREQSEHLAKAHKRLAGAVLGGLNLRLFQDLKTCTLLEPSTLLEFSCGVYLDPPVEWLVVPYQTGYNCFTLFNESASNQRKAIYSLVNVPASGAIPYITFFGLDNLAEKENLFITESSFETMLLWQYLQHEEDLDGDVVGFIPNKSLRPYPTNEQLNWLKGVLNGRYKNIYLIMNDTPSLVVRLTDNALSYANKVSGVNLFMADIPVLTDGRFATYLDVMKHPEQIDFSDPITKALKVN